MTGRTYSILRSSRQNQETIETVVDTGMSWEDADRKRNERDDAERKAHPELSSWTRDIYIVRLEAHEAGSPTPATAHV